MSAIMASNWVIGAFAGTTALTTVLFALWQWSLKRPRPVPLRYKAGFRRAESASNPDRLYVWLEMYNPCEVAIFVLSVTVLDWEGISYLRKKTDEEVLKRSDPIRARNVHAVEIELPTADWNAIKGMFDSVSQQNFRIIRQIY